MGKAGQDGHEPAKKAARGVSTPAGAAGRCSGGKAGGQDAQRRPANRKNWEVSERPADRYVTVDDPRTGLPVSMPAGTDPGWDMSHRRSLRLDRLREALAEKRRRAR